MPIPYSEALAEAICERVADGASLTEICAAPGVPSRATIRRWLADQPAFRRRFARAHEDQADAYVDQILQAARAAGDEPVAVQKLRIDTLKWLAAKRRPSVYGARFDRGTPQDVDPDSLTDDELAAIAGGCGPAAAGAEGGTE